MSNKCKTIPALETLRLEATPGYFPDGVSQYSHSHRAGSDARMFRDRLPPRSLTRLEVQIKHERAVVARLERRVAEGKADAADKLAKTQAFLARLVAEQRSRANE
jgi:hypothetical protein